MKNYEKIESLREELNKTLDPKIKEYVEAELGYWSEVDNGYVAADRLKAELRLIAAIQALTKPMEKWPDKKHESHKSVRSSDASTFDFICDDCGATDDVTFGWGTLRKPCKAQMQTAFEAATEAMNYDEDGYTIWNSSYLL